MTRAATAWWRYLRDDYSGVAYSKRVPGVTAAEAIETFKALHPGTRATRAVGMTERERRELHRTERANA